jgi:CheY-like chemotaxis protein
MAGRVLCADADARTRGILRESLLGQGYQVETRRDGAAAYESLANDAFDLALLDVQLPSRDGFDVLEQIRQRPSPLCDIPVFLLSPTRITPAYQQRARRGGATALLVKPVPLARLHGLIRKHIKEGPPSVQTAEPVPIPSQSSPFDGDLRELDFPSLLHHLHGRRSSGVLVLESARKRKVVQLREGYPVSIKSNLLGECFGQRLIERGLISQQQFEESVVRMKAGEGLQGQILVAMQVMDEAAVGEALLEQAEQKLLEIFGWRRGSFAFRPAAALKGGIALPRDRSPAIWLLRGVRDRMPIETIDRKLRKQSRRLLARPDTAFYRLQDVELDPVSKTLLEQADGQTTIGELLGGDEATRRALYGLVVTGLVETCAGRDGESPKPATEQRKRSRSAGKSRAASDERELRTELAAMAARMRRQNDFEVLGLVPGADTDAIEAAFEEVARGSHPDRYQNYSASVRSLADGVFARIEAAYARLRDSRARGEYLLELRQGERRKAQAREDERALEAEVEFQKGEAHLRSRSYQAALLCFGNALERKPQEGEYIAHYGWCLYLIHPDETAMVEEAIEHVKRGLKLARDHDKPYLFLGRLYKATGKVEAAERMFARAVELRPESVEALRELRLINMRRSKQGLIGRILRR